MNDPPAFLTCGKHPLHLLPGHVTPATCALIGRSHLQKNAIKLNIGEIHFSPIMHLGLSPLASDGDDDDDAAAWMLTSNSPPFLFAIASLPW